MAIGIRLSCTLLERASAQPDDRDRDDLRSDRGVRDGSPLRPGRVLLDGVLPPRVPLRTFVPLCDLLLFDSR